MHAMSEAKQQESPSQESPSGGDFVERERASLFPIGENLAAPMPLVMADLSESQRGTLMNLIYRRGVNLTALALEQLRGFVITLFHAPKSSLDNPSYSHRSGSRPLFALSHGQLSEYDHWALNETQKKKDSLTFVRTSSATMMRSSAIG